MRTRKERTGCMGRGQGGRGSEQGTSELGKGSKDGDQRQEWSQLLDNGGRKAGIKATEGKKERSSWKGISLKSE